MHTAFLIIAHHQPNHLARLVRALSTLEATFFIHIDSKVSDAPFRKAVGANSKTIFVEERVRVNWGGFSQVRATLALLAAATKSGVPFHRFCLLSGSDFPIKRNSAIWKEFDSDKEFMRVDRRLGPTENHTHCGNVRAYYFMDAPAPIRSVLSGRLKRRPYEEVDLYHGAQWWALTRNCVDYIFKFLAGNADYSSFLERALCPDEIFFHSIVKQSPFASFITDDFERVANRAEYFLSNTHGSHYIDWNAKVGKLPKTLGLEDLESLLRSSALFARKFDEQKSRQLIIALEERLAG